MATWYQLVDDRRPQKGKTLPAHQAASSIRSARKKPAKVIDAVHVYATTGRDGTPLHIGYVHYAPGYWSYVTDAIDIYEIPTEALADL